MLLLKCGLLLLLLPVCSFTPGFLLVRRLRWTPLEKLVSSVAASLVLLYLASAAIYGLGLDWTLSCYVLSAVCALLLAVEVPDLKQLARGAGVRPALQGFAFLWLWTLLLLGIIRHFSGGGWSTDWLEHFERILYFLHRFPVASPLVEGYALPARPPMMNLLGAFFLAQTGDRFEYYQLVFAFLNLLVFLPCFLIAPAIGLRGRRRAAPLVALFAASPVVMQNTTYPWTKLLAAFYVVLAIWFYLRGWLRRDSFRMAAAFACLSAGMLVHYSTGPYFVFVGLHYVFFVWARRPNRWRELAAAVSVSAVLLATWFIWSVAVYGARTTVASNTSVTPSQRVEGSNAAKIAANLFDTVVPHPLRSDASTGLLQQASTLGYVRDYFFLIYQTNAIFGLGLLGGPLALYLLYRARLSPRDVRRFWFLLVGFCLVAGVAVHGERETFGVAHVTLQPLLLLGICLLAGSFARLPRIAAWVLVAGCVLDFAVGVAPQALVESRENGPGDTVFYGLTNVGGRVVFGQPELFSHRSWLNWYGKHQYRAAGEWLAQLRAMFPAAAPPAIAQLRGALENSRAEDARLWRGWYFHNGGEMTFLGDWIAGRLPGGIALPFTLLTILFFSILTSVVRQIPKPAMSAPPKKPVRRRPVR